MQSTTARIGLLAALAAVAVVLFVVLSGDDDNGGETTTTTATAPTTTDPGSQPPAGPPVITVRDGKPVGGVQDLTFNKGDRVEFEVRLDQPAEEVHVHGYEIEEPAATSPVTVSFPADIDGVFEVEVHSHELGDVEIGQLTINP